MYVIIKFRMSLLLIRSQFSSLDPIEKVEFLNCFIIQISCLKHKRWTKEGEMSMSTNEAKVKSHSIPNKFELISTFKLLR